MRSQIHQIADELQGHPGAFYTKGFPALTLWTIAPLADVFEQHAAHLARPTSSVDLRENDFHFNDQTASCRAREGNLPLGRTGRTLEVPYSAPDT